MIAGSALLSEDLGWLETKGHSPTLLAVVAAGQSLSLISDGIAELRAHHFAHHLLGKALYQRKTGEKKTSAANSQPRYNDSLNGPAND